MRRTTLTLIAAGATILGLAACDPNATKGDSTQSPAANTAVTPPAPNATPAEATAPVGAEAKAGTLPNFVGMGLQFAQDTAQKAGFYTLTSHDALGRNRNQISDRNWKVCTQNPAPGDHPTTEKIDMGAVKLDETCPTLDQGASSPTKASASMPDFKGKAVSVVRDSLDKATSITAKDASNQNRVILVQSNWQVCSQEPAVGAALTGQPVTVKAVKFGETCP
ncbi:hypothetical protein ACFV6D_32785 [Kitasatospora sp. NPDC059812]|uniref:hypothetical protein n=1 Tax=Kitasatospora sp. NPDC059812 TaxID=3346958 RepID=UPI00364CBC47